MTVRFLVNFGLLALPIAITLGILFGLEKHREATGGPPLFKPQPDPTKPKRPNDNGITVEQYCQKSYGIHPETKGLEFTREFFFHLPRWLFFVCSFYRLLFLSFPFSPP